MGLWGQRKNLRLFKRRLLAVSRRSSQFENYYLNGRFTPKSGSLPNEVGYFRSRPLAEVQLVLLRQHANDPEPTLQRFYIGLLAKEDTEKL